MRDFFISAVAAGQDQISISRANGGAAVVLPVIEALGTAEALHSGDRMALAYFGTGHPISRADARRVARVIILTAGDLLKIAEDAPATEALNRAKIACLPHASPESLQ